MAPTRKRRSASRRQKRQDTVRAPRTGAPAADSVSAVVPFTSPTGRTYRIIKTTELDAYDKPLRAKALKRRSKRNA
jgi:hypothetical protein